MSILRTGRTNPGDRVRMPRTGGGLRGPTRGPAGGREADVTPERGLPAGAGSGPACVARGRERDRPAIRITLMGGFAVTVDGVPRRLPGEAGRLVALLAVMDTKPGLRSRARLAASLWPGLDRTRRRARLGAALRDLRASAPRPIVEARGRTLRLVPGTAVDSEELEAEIAGLFTTLDALLGFQRPERLTEELLPAWEDDWVRAERRRLRDLCRLALDEYIHGQVAHASLEAARRVIEMALRADPLHEYAARGLIGIQIGAGERAGAVATYSRFRDHFVARFGVEPGEMEEFFITFMTRDWSAPLDFPEARDAE